MRYQPSHVLVFTRDSLQFVHRVFTTFMKNQGLLLVGAQVIALYEQRPGRGRSSRGRGTEESCSEISQ
jgi:hypothetical protein